MVISTSPAALCLGSHTVTHHIHNYCSRTVQGLRWLRYISIYSFVLAALSAPTQTVLGVCLPNALGCELKRMRDARLAAGNAYKPSRGIVNNCPTSLLPVSL
jgi:hypothetical protein